MNSFQLFRKRMLRDWRYQLRSFRSIADWTIWLYLIIPSMAIFIYMYRSWWVEAAPQWTEWLPLTLFFLLASLVAWGGAFRTYVDEADKVFLVKKRKTFHQMKRWGFWYSILYQGILTAIVLVILLPFMLLHYQLTWFHVVSFFIYVLGLKYFLMFLSLQLKRIDIKLIRIFTSILLFVVVNILSFYVSALWEQYLFLILLGVILGGLGISLYYPMIKRTSMLEMELAQEREEKLKFINLIYTISFEIEKPKGASKRKPWLFRNSYLIFKNRTAKNAFIELFVKVFIRDGSHLTTYFQICSVTSAALIVVPPLWIKAVIFGAFLFMMWSWLEGIWERIVLQHPFTKKYTEHDSYFAAKKIIIIGLFVLSIIFISSIVGVGLWVYSLFSILT